MVRGIVLVDHGSRVPEANAVLDALAAQLADQLPEAQVRAAHMELAAPSLGDAVEELVAAGVEEIVVVPYFTVPGRHSRRDIPEQIRRAQAAHPALAFRLGAPLGAHPGLIPILLEQIRNAEAR